MNTTLRPALAMTAAVFGALIVATPAHALMMPTEFDVRMGDIPTPSVTMEVEGYCIPHHSPTGGDGSHPGIAYTITTTDAPEGAALEMQYGDESGILGGHPGESGVVATGAGTFDVRARMHTPTYTYESEGQTLVVEKCFDDDPKDIPVLRTPSFTG